MKNRIEEEHNKNPSKIIQYLRLARFRTAEAIRKGTDVQMDIGDIDAQQVREVSKWSRKLGFSFNDAVVAAVMYAIDNDPKFRRKRRVRRLVSGRAVVTDERIEQRIVEGHPAFLASHLRESQRRILGNGLDCF